ncbi:TPA: UDP-N-acetylmuramoyl-L-alanine--D-glutamate ligase [Candidatus Dependentiae bacterium]|nr:MAG: UDP-N-acetylmuramoylalanine-D-glutamate ligase [candidate division TM6 bacterium GW2011_GWE2_31_21]KKP53561.1 MAG: UDP-N-acetylmuramoylalanine-D-glutamate ligase [candidate division TM6 bacterium GW2011_GWF2_33_332]HBS48198.1 UDP-N-acetylmuramoyl-L-alanine--D-glutamate ligase [Candidatus Dependentiae bacterium]HBZ73624.1 UDP-N-acetylmuramoyl-L-alanine--D-glutamate ligase [Candidatus Dependentiae bacterium]
MQKIGILGFGVVGKSTLNFLKKIQSPLEQFDPKNIKISVFDQKDLTSSEIAEIESFGAEYFTSKDVSLFLQSNGYIIASPGVDLSAYNKFANKFICELDLFAQVFNKKTVAITGTLGKTTVTNMIYKITSSFTDFAVNLGGNIGSGMLNLALKNNDVDLAILELSSFQLEPNTKFAPDLALFTNFYPNHLDRHLTTKNYFDAKWKIFEHQSSDQVSIIPLSLFNLYEDLPSKLATLKSQICFISSNPISDEDKERIKKFGKMVFFAEKENLYFGSFKAENFVSFKIADLNNLPSSGFLENWVLILTTFYLLAGNCNFLNDEKWTEKLISTKFNPSVDAYRLEHFANFKGIDFYDDSKSTVIQATKAALDKLINNKRPVILILGGLDKGVDRSPFFKDLQNIPQENLKSIFCLGKDPQKFGGYKTFPTLQDLVDEIMKIAKSGDQVLFSPGGTSFDFFKNYKHRGDLFKEVVREYACKGESVKS